MKAWAKFLALSISAVAALSPAFAQDEEAKAPSTDEVLAAAPAADWITIPITDLMVLTLPADKKGPKKDRAPKKITIQLLPQPFARGHVRNVRKMARAHWWDGTKLYRVQRNAFTQWGGNYDQKKLPKNLETVSENEFVNLAMGERRHIDMTALNTAIGYSNTYRKTSIKPLKDMMWDPYKATVGYAAGWPVGSKIQKDGTTKSWPIFCRGMVSPAHYASPDAGSGAELSTITGRAARNLDHEFGIVGRVIDGLEHLINLPLGDPPNGFYENPKDRIPITSIRLMSELPKSQHVQYEYLASHSVYLAQYIQAHRTYEDICGYPVPIRRKAAD